jgi:hypothetical protein
MPLNPETLRSFFYRLSTTEKPSGPAEAAQRIALAYTEYASGAIAAGFPFLAPGPASPTMTAALAAALSMRPGVAPTVAAGYASMVTGFWGGATFVFAPAPGIAAPPVGVGALVAALSGIFSIPNNPAEIYAAQVSLALDACTRTTLVTFVPPLPASPFVSPVA